MVNLVEVLCRIAITVVWQLVANGITALITQIVRALQ
jgi:hypothetical protein